MKQVKTYIYLILLLIVMLFLATLLLPFSFSSNAKASNEKYEYVMWDIFQDKDSLITNIAMLGAHDAFSNNLSYNSMPDENDRDIVTHPVTQVIAKGLAIKFTKAQTASATTLLKSGVRYLDVRITKIDDKYYTTHKYVSDYFEVYLRETIDFLDSHLGEFIIYDIQHFSTKMVPIVA